MKHFLFFLMACCCIATYAEADSLDIKIGQMILMGIDQRKSIADDDSLLLDIKAGKLGGVLLFEKNISDSNATQKLKDMCSKLQSAANIPLFVSIDEEGGKVHRLKEKYGFVAMPSATALGKINNNDSTYYYNNRLAKELASLGINLNFAPSVDLRVNEKNKVIVQTGRSFSSDPNIVANNADACIHAHHDNGIYTSLKHFPGHGSSLDDSHLGLVDVTNTWGFEELLPYYQILKKGNCDAVMIAHLINKNWDTTKTPSTLSYRVVTDILRNLIGYKGLTFSDDMQMKAITKYYGLETAIEKAINAGIDVVMFGNNVFQSDKVSLSQVHAIIKSLVLSGKIPESRINESYQRIIALKSKCYHNYLNIPHVSAHFAKQKHNKKTKYLLLAGAEYKIHKGLFENDRLNNLERFKIFASSFSSQQLQLLYEVNEKAADEENTLQFLKSKLDTLKSYDIHAKNIFIAIGDKQIRLIDKLVASYPNMKFNFLLTETENSIDFSKWKKSKSNFCVITHQKLKDESHQKNVRYLHCSANSNTEFMGVYNWLEPWMKFMKWKKSNRS